MSSVAFISGVGRLNDPWGDLVNYFRDLSLTQVKYRLVADRVNQLSERHCQVGSFGRSCRPSSSDDDQRICRVKSTISTAPGVPLRIPVIVIGHSGRR